MKKSKQYSKGITLIALTVTIVVLIILASISIGALTGENGIINQARQAKEETEISEEKEIIDISVTQTIGEDEEGNVQKDILKNKLDANTGSGKTEVIEGGEATVVKFVEKERYYEIDENGNIEGPKKLMKDENSGDLTKGNTCNGTQEKLFEINCIEDLVTFSIMVNGGNSEKALNFSTFNEQYIALKRTLNFKSIFSYDDYTTTKYGDLNSDGIVENILTELTKTEEGCTGFTPIGGASKNANHTFSGIFNGNGYEIRNIYQNFTDPDVAVALFGRASGEIKNVTLTGIIKNNDVWLAGGILGRGSAKITNCKNYASVSGYNFAGGICAYLDGSTFQISDCINYGTINITGRGYDYGGAGGIVGGTSDSVLEVQINNCVNKGSITGNDNNIGGIIGCSNMTTKIYNCTNNESVNGAGILGWGRNVILDMKNCNNLGECKNGIMNNFSGTNWSSIVEANINNCYNLGKCSEAGLIGKQGTICSKITLNIANCYNAGISSKAIIGDIIANSKTVTTTNILNTYYDNTKVTDIGAYSEGITGLSILSNKEFVETLNSNIGSNIDWKKWKVGEDGYPVFID